jgi:transposase
MPRAYPSEFRARAVALVRAGKQQRQMAEELGIHPITLSKWLRQDRIVRGEIEGVPSSESAELRAARRRIRELETELIIVRQAAEFLGEERPRPKGLPGDRSTRRHRGPRQGQLSCSGSCPPELLQGETNADHTDLGASAMADRGDP